MIDTPSLVDQYRHGVLRTGAGPRHLRGPAGTDRGPARPRHDPLRHPDRLRRTPLVPAPARPRTALPARPLSGPAPGTGRPWSPAAGCCGAAASPPTSSTPACPATSPAPPNWPRRATPRRTRSSGWSSSPSRSPTPPAPSSPFWPTSPESVHGAAATAVAFTSVAGLRHGLALAPEPPGPGEVRGAAGRWLAGRRAGGALTDAVLLRHLLWIAVASGLPLQLHTGLGEPGARVDRTDPVLLTDFVRATAGLGTDLILLHGYPYHRHAAHLAAVFPHVYADSGAALVRTGARAAAVLAEILELAPSARSLLHRRAGPARAARRRRPPLPRGPRPRAGRLGRRGRLVPGGRPAGRPADRGGQRATGAPDSARARPSDHADPTGPGRRTGVARLGRCGPTRCSTRSGAASRPHAPSPSGPTAPWPAATTRRGAATWTSSPYCRAAPARGTPGGWRPCTTGCAPPRRLARKLHCGYPTPDTLADPERAHLTWAHEGCCAAPHPCHPARAARLRARLLRGGAGRAAPAGAGPAAGRLRRPRPARLLASGGGQGPAVAAGRLGRPRAAHLRPGHRDPPRRPPGLQAGRPDRTARTRRSRRGRGGHRATALRDPARPGRAGSSAGPS